MIIPKSLSQLKQMNLFKPPVSLQSKITTKNNKNMSHITKPINNNLFNRLYEQKIGKIRSSQLIHVKQKQAQIEKECTFKPNSHKNGISEFSHEMTVSNSKKEQTHKTLDVSSTFQRLHQDANERVHRKKVAYTIAQNHKQNQLAIDCTFSPQITKQPKNAVMYCLSLFLCYVFISTCMEQI